MSIYRDGRLVDDKIGFDQLVNAGDSMIVEAPSERRYTSVRIAAWRWAKRHRKVIRTERGNGIVTVKLIGDRA